MYDIDEITAYIRQSAAARGVDPDVAVRAARTEGLAPGVWQSNARNKKGIREPSYGPFQMLVGGPGTGFGSGLGNAFMRDTGLDPRDPRNVKSTIDYALNTVGKEGWQQWYGPKNAGISRWDGVKGRRGLNINSAPVSVASGGVAPPLPAPADFSGVVASAAAPEADRPGGIQGIQDILATFRDTGAKEGFNALSQGLDKSGGFDALAKLVPGGGGSGQQQSQEMQIDPANALAATEASDAGRMQAAQSLMAQLMATKKRMPGMSLMG